MLPALLFAAAISLSPVGTRDLAGAQTVVNNVNQHRTQAGETPLTEDAQLTAVAMDRASDLLRRHYFAHVSPDGTTAIDELRSRAIPFGYAGENLAEAGNVSVADAALWASPEHRDNIVETHYRRIGIAVVDSPDVGTLIVQIFAD